MGTYAFAIPPPILHLFVLFQSAHLTFSFPPSFFSNKAAVAGVFSVVGLIGLVILVVLLTNAVRRHRAKQFDNELFAATREAAATAPNPIFLDDDDDSEERLKPSSYSQGYGGGGSIGYNGKTYPDGPSDSYNMSNMVPVAHSVPVGEIYDPYASRGLAGGVAGIGVARARSDKQNFHTNFPTNYAAALQEGGSPYPKFARGPNTEFGDSREQQQPYAQGSPPPQEHPALGRTKSSSTAGGHGSTPSLTQSYTQQPQYPLGQLSPPRSAATPGLVNPHTHKAEHSGGSDAAYGGFVDEADEEEEEEAPRVLKVC